MGTISKSILTGAGIVFKKKLVKKDTGSTHHRKTQQLPAQQVVQQAVAIDFICLRLQPELIDDEIDKAECSGNQTENGKNGCFSTHKNTSSKQWESLLPL